MAELDIRLNIDKDKRRNIEQMLTHIPNGAKKAMAQALNRTIVGVEMGVTRAIREKYIIRQKDIRETLSLQKATTNVLFACLRSRSAAMPLDKFAYSPKRISPRPPVGVRVRVWRAGGGNAIPGVFLINKGSIQGLFHRISGAPKVPITYYDANLGRRVTRMREPIRKNYGPSVASMMKEVLADAPGANDGIQQRAMARLEKELNHQVEYLLMKNAGGGR